MAKASDLLPLVSEILFYEWDPIGVNQFPMARDEYDSYTWGIVGLLLDDADEYKITAYLGRVQGDSIALDVTEELNRVVARRLLGLVADR